MSIVRDVYATDGAFVAVSDGGQIIAAWGAPACGGTLPRHYEGLRVSQVVASSRAFAAVDCAERIVAWGDLLCGGDCSSLPTHRCPVLLIACTSRAFAAATSDDILAWGDPRWGGAICYNFSGLPRGGGEAIPVSMVLGTAGAFAAFSSAQRLVCTWGSYDHGALPPGSCGLLARIRLTVCNEFAYAADIAVGLRTWGDSECGGDHAHVAHLFQGNEVVSLHASRAAFSARMRSGSTFITWGSRGQASQLEVLLGPVPCINGLNASFMAIGDTGADVVEWSVEGRCRTIYLHGPVRDLRCNATHAVALLDVNLDVNVANDEEFFGYFGRGLIFHWRPVQRSDNRRHWFDNDFKCGCEGQAERVYLTQQGASFAAIMEQGSIRSWGSRLMALGGEQTETRRLQLRQIVPRSGARVTALDEYSGPWLDVSHVQT